MVRRRPETLDETGADQLDGAGEGVGGDEPQRDKIGADLLDVRGDELVGQQSRGEGVDELTHPFVERGAVAGNVAGVRERFGPRDYEHAAT